MAFRFALDAVLRVARVRERSEWGKLQSIQAEVNAVSGTLRDIIDAQMQLRQEMSSEGQVSVSAVWLHVVDDMIGSMQFREKEIRGHLQSLRTSLQQQREIYIAARQRCEALERVRHARYAEYRREVLRQEQIALDDLFLTRRH
jgi:flagellar export protein FliJ